MVGELEGVAKVGHRTRPIRDRRSDPLKIASGRGTVHSERGTAVASLNMIQNRLTTSAGSKWRRPTVLPLDRVYMR
jgi:hypothetical protein